jgi:putative membrane protein
MMTGFGMMGGLFMIVFWGGLIALVVWLVIKLFPGVRGQTNSPSGNEMNARDIIDQRYARGELSREEYELMKQDLAKGN